MARSRTIEQYQFSVPSLPLEAFRTLESFFDLVAPDAPASRVSKQWYILQALLVVASESDRARGLIAQKLQSLGLPLSPVGIEAITRMSQP